MVRLRTFQFYDGAKVMHIQITLSLGFGSFPGLVIRGALRHLLPGWASQSRPWQPRGHEGKRPMTVGAILSLTVSTAFSQ